MAVKETAVILLLVALGTRADFQWTVGGDGMSCTATCNAQALTAPGAQACVSSVTIDVVADFQTILTNAFPADSAPCDGTQAGDIVYDPSASDYYCGWKTDAPGDTFNCDAVPPRRTRRFCPCGTVGSVVASQPEVMETNLRKVNLKAYTAWKGAPPPVAAAVTSAPQVEAPRAAPQTGLDTNLGGAGSDYYSIVNIANDRAMYALSKPMEGTDGTDSKGVGASHDWEGSAEQDWRVRAAGMQGGVPVFRLINDVSQRRLYAMKGIEGIDGKTGFGATDSATQGEDELWFITEVPNDGHDSRFKIQNALSKRYMYAMTGINDDLGFGASATPTGKNIEWSFRVQSRQVVDGSTVEFFPISSSSTDLPFCVVASAGLLTSGGASVSCDGSGPSDTYARFTVNILDPTAGTFSLKSEGVNKFCTAAPEMTCQADAAGPAETFTVIKEASGAVELKSGALFCFSGADGLGCTTTAPPGGGSFEVRCVDNCAKIETIEEYDMFHRGNRGKVAASTNASGVLYFGGVAFVLFGFVAAVYRRRRASGEHRNYELEPVYENGRAELLVE